MEVMRNNWNPFGDPSSTLILLSTFMVCKAFHLTFVTIANYLEIWFVPAQDDAGFNPLRGFENIKGIDEEIEVR
jgi:hypothetical protein